MFSKPYRYSHQLVAEINSSYTENGKDADMMRVLQDNNDAVLLRVMPGYCPQQSPPTIPKLAKMFQDGSTQYLFNFMQSIITPTIIEDTFIANKEKINVHCGEDKELEVCQEVRCTSANFQKIM